MPKPRVCHVCGQRVLAKDKHRHETTLLDTRGRIIGVRIRHTTGMCP